MLQFVSESWLSGEAIAGLDESVVLRSGGRGRTAKALPCEREQHSKVRHRSSGGIYLVSGRSPPAH